jgi:hypothetical protein
MPIIAQLESHMVQPEPARQSTQRFYSDEYGLEIETYRSPDSVGDDFIADAKWYTRVSVMSSSHLRDYVRIASQEGKPLWLC